jgi:putative pyruvate formate lyase activating enzyme
MGDLSSLRIWLEDDLCGRLAWYRAVADDRAPAKFLIARHVPVCVSLAEASEEALWDELETRTAQFVDRWSRIRKGEADLPEEAPPSPNLLELCAELVQRMLRHCNFCRFDCRVDRSEARRFGTCRLGSESRVSSYFHHPGEELVYRGSRGSGTIFFTSCNMRCAFCQNGDISTDKDNGQVVSARVLATMAWLLRIEGCHNVNWVGGDPTIHLHNIIEAIALLPTFEPTEADVRAALPAKADFYGHLRGSRSFASYRGAFNAPMLWNSNFFMTPEAMKILRLTMDVWLPDFKFGPDRCAARLSKTPFYWDTVTANLELIHQWGEDLTIRHLVMPNHVECCTRPVFEWVATHMPEVPVNVMDQYHPDNFCEPAGAKFNPKYADIARRPSRSEIREAFRHAKRLGLRFEALSYEKNMTGVMLE